MELLQSQAPIDQELSGSSASARHGTLDIEYQTWDVGFGTQKFGYIEEKLLQRQSRGDKKRLKNMNDLLWFPWFVMVGMV